MVEGEEVMVTEVVVMKEDKPGGGEEDLQGTEGEDGLGSVGVGETGRLGKSNDIAAKFLCSKKALMFISLHRDFQLHNR